MKQRIALTETSTLTRPKTCDCMVKEMFDRLSLNSTEPFFLVASSGHPREDAVRGCYEENCFRGI